jgi:hypothetical protein
MTQILALPAFMMAKPKTISQTFILFGCVIHVAHNSFMGTCPKAAAKSRIRAYCTIKRGTREGIIFVGLLPLGASCVFCPFMAFMGNTRPKVNKLLIGGDSTRLDASRRDSTRLDATRRVSTLLDATRRYSTLLDATRR